MDKTKSVPSEPSYGPAGIRSLHAAELVPGEPCPTCGKPVGKSKATLQREYRERKKNG